MGFNLSVNRRQVGLILVSVEKPEGDKLAGGTESACPPINVLACTPEGCSTSNWKFNSLKVQQMELSFRQRQVSRHIGHMTTVAQVTWSHG